jgi:hypothetical protein
LTPRVNPTKLWFLCFFPIFAFKLGHFKVQTIFFHATNTQAYQQKTEKIFGFTKKFYRIDSETEKLFVKNVERIYWRKVDVAEIVKQQPKGWISLLTEFSNAPQQQHQNDNININISINNVIW